jgi:hypothetical protein
MLFRNNQRLKPILRDCNQNSIKLKSLKFQTKINKQVFINRIQRFQLLL